MPEQGFRAKLLQSPNCRKRSGPIEVLISKTFVHILLRCLNLKIRDTQCTDVFIHYLNSTDIAK